MSGKPLISAITIFLNEERFLQEAIESVFAQTYDEWELLLVNDGSTDGSTEIALRYAEKHPGRVRYLEHDGQETRGMSASRNLGIRNARGEYIAYLDGDDVWLPDKLERQVPILESQPEAVMVCGPLQRWYSWTGDPADIHRDSLRGVGAGGVHPYTDTIVKPPKLLTLFLQHETFIPAGILVKRQILETLDGHEEIFRGGYEDAVFLVKLCLSSAVFVSSECWYKYRIHPDSCERVTVKAGKSGESRLFFLNWVEDYLSKKQVKEPEVWYALRTAKSHCRHPHLYRLLDYRHGIRQIENLAVKLGRRVLPAAVRSWLWAHWASIR